MAQVTTLLLATATVWLQPDPVLVEGVSRTPAPVVASASGLADDSRRSPAALERATRRLRELPALSAADLVTQPRAGGAPLVTAVVTERPLYPTGVAGWAMVGLNAAFVREIRLGLYGLARHADAIDGAYRFRKRRPRVRAEFALPVPGRVPGVVAVEALWDAQEYDRAAIGRDASRRETRRRFGARWSDWATRWLRWQVAAAADRFDADQFGTVEATIVARGAGDSVMVRGVVGRWFTASTRGFSSADVTVGWRSRAEADNGRWGWRATGGLTRVTASAPLALWPVGSSSSGRGVLLRGHGLYDDGFVTSPVFGRRLAFGSIEYAHGVWRDAAGAVAVAGFLDVGRAWQRAEALPPSDWQFDVGLGLRLESPAAPGQIRLDLGYATRTGRTSLSAGFVLPWGA